jgi:RNA polymerase sigma factor (sigma-70 family)
MTNDKDVNYSDYWDKFRTQNCQECLSAIYLDHYDVLFNFGLKYTTDKQIIENAIQAVFSYFLKVRKKLGAVNNISGYLIQSFRRQLLLELKNQKKIVPFETLHEGFGFFSAQEQDEYMEEGDQKLKIVKQIISELSPKQQEIIYLRFNCNLSYEEISSLLEITVESCYKSVYRSVSAIRSKAEKFFSSKKGGSSGSTRNSMILFLFSLKALVSGKNKLLA